MCHRERAAAATPLLVMGRRGGVGGSGSSSVNHFHDGQPHQHYTSNNCSPSKQRAARWETRLQAAHHMSTTLWISLWPFFLRFSFWRKKKNSQTSLRAELSTNQQPPIRYSSAKSRLVSASNHPAIFIHRLPSTWCGLSRSPLCYVILSTRWTHSAS